jgi:serine/threonine protein kinase
LFESEQLKNKLITHLPDTSIYLKKVIQSVFKLEDPNDTYRKLKKINKGSSGLIYKCKRLDTGEEVAMKMVVPKNRAEYEAI